GQRAGVAQGHDGHKQFLHADTRDHVGIAIEAGTHASQGELSAVRNNERRSDHVAEAGAVAADAEAAGTRAALRRSLIDNLVSEGWSRGERYRDRERYCC